MCRIKDYYNQMEQTYDSGKVYIYSNTDRAHNAAIMLLMLSKASGISMFCGSLSILRKSFYTHIEKEISVEDSSFLLNGIMEAWTRFISRDGSSIKIILENKRDFSKDDLIIPLEDLNSKKVSISYLPDYVDFKDKINHFSFSEDNRILRIEIDKNSHEAFCKVGEADASTVIARDNFSKLAKLSKKLTA